MASINGPILLRVKDMGYGGYRLCEVTIGQGIGITVIRNQDEHEKDYYINLAFEDLQHIAQIVRAVVNKTWI